MERSVVPVDVIEIAFRLDQMRHIRSAVRGGDGRRGGMIAIVVLLFGLLISSLALLVSSLDWAVGFASFGLVLTVIGISRGQGILEARLRVHSRAVFWAGFAVSAILSVVCTVLAVSTLLDILSWPPPSMNSREFKTLLMTVIATGWLAVVIGVTVNAVASPILHFGEFLFGSSSSRALAFCLSISCVSFVVTGLIVTGVVGAAISSIGLPVAAGLIAIGLLLGALRLIWVSVAQRESLTNNLSRELAKLAVLANSWRRNSDSATMGALMEQLATVRQLLAPGLISTQLSMQRPVASVTGIWLVYTWIEHVLAGWPMSASIKVVEFETSKEFNGATQDEVIAGLEFASLELSEWARNVVPRLTRREAVENLPVDVRRRGSYLPDVVHAGR